MKWSHCWIVSIYCTRDTRFGQSFNIVVNVWPPHMLSLAIDFIRTTPGWVSWKRRSMLLFKHTDNTTLSPHIKIPLWTAYLFRWGKYGRTDTGKWLADLGHPLFTWRTTLDRTGSRVVRNLINLLVTGFSANIWWTLLSSSRSSGTLVDNGKRDNSSALPWEFVLRYTTSYTKPLRKRAFYVILWQPRKALHD